MYTQPFRGALLIPTKLMFLAFLRSKSRCPKLKFSASDVRVSINLASCEITEKITNVFCDHN